MSLSSSFNRVSYTSVKQMEGLQAYLSKRIHAIMGHVLRLSVHF